MKRINGQQSLQLDFGEPSMPDPNQCEFELKRWRLKTCCLFQGREIWTNCREFGRCIWDGWHQHGQQELICDTEDE